MSDIKEIQFISIVSRWNAERVLYRGEHASIREALVAAAASGADLRGAYLSGAYLSGAYLRDANLRDADMSGADMSGANLRDADLRDADLRGANLRDANLRDADLRGADMSGANLRDADMSGADMSDIKNAVPDLAVAKADLWSVFGLVPSEVPAVRAALCAGKVDGSTYSGACSCLVGTIARARGCSEYDIPGIKPNADRPAEQFFMRIRPGHIPAVNYHAALAVLWIDEWLAVHPVETHL